MDEKINSYWDYITEETYKKGSLYFVISFVLFFIWAAYETAQDFFLPLVVLRVLQLFILISIPILFKILYNRRKNWIIPIYTIALNLSLFLVICVCIIIKSSTKIPEFLTTNYPMGLLCFMMVLTFGALGSKTYCKYTFPIQIIAFNIFLFTIGVEEPRQLMMVNMLTIFMVYEMNTFEKHQKEHYYAFKKTIDLSQSELMRTNEELNGVNAKLKEINIALSHDLKTPIRNIMSFAQILERKTKDKLTEQEREYLGHVMQSTKHMHNLVEAMLQFVNVSYGNIKEIETVDLQKVFNSLKDNYRSLEHEKKLSLHLQENPPKIKGNYSRIYLLMQNIIDNGIKYNHSDLKTIEISHYKLKDKVYIQIKDNGIGIEEKYQSRIFKPFKRLHTKDSYQGSGIGLAFCSEVMRQAGGTIKIESSASEGSKFILEFPEEILVN